MDELTLKYENVCNAFDSFTKAVKYYQKYLSRGYLDEDTFDEREVYDYQIESARTALIKIFELFIELLFKHLKWVLENRLNLELDLVNPRAIIIESAKSRLITESQSLHLIELTRTRNQTSHIYKEDLANEVAKALCASLPSLRELLVCIDPERFKELG
ncbi:MAG: nucleotidyltransferase substrate binding protein [bacterium]